MDFDQTCLDFLDHFDRPKTVDLKDSPRAVVEHSESPAAGEDYFALPEPTQSAIQTRGVRWVLQWAGALAVLIVAASVLTRFVYLAGATHAMDVAARAGATEATLPRATYQSVTAAVEQRLADYPQLNSQLHVALLQNGSPISRPLRVGDGDRFSITLSAPASAVVPSWLGRLSFWRGDKAIIAHAERQVPDGNLWRIR